MPDPANAPAYIEAVAFAVGARYPANVKTLFGEKNLPGHGAPPRFVWVPGPRRPARTGVTSGNSNPRAFGTDDAFAFIHCWAKTPELAWRMAMSLTTALRRVLGPTRYDFIDATPLALENAFVQSGDVVVAQYALKLPHYEIDLATFGDGTDPTATLSKQDEAPFGPPPSGPGIAIPGDT